LSDGPDALAVFAHDKAIWVLQDILSGYSKKDVIAIQASDDILLNTFERV
jgi:hypothetical protein